MATIKPFAGQLLRVVLLLGVVAASAQCEAQTVAGELSGTLKKAQSSGTVAIGYRDSSVPFSYASAEGNPIGYSIDLCRNVVSELSDEVGKPLSITWVPVTSESRISSLLSGKIDLECGSTTNNAARRDTVSFSPITFVAGTKLLVPANSPIKSFRDLTGKTVVVTAGTTNEAAMQSIQTKFKVSFNIIVAADHAQSYATMASGKADAFATDDAILYGLVAKNKAQKQFFVVGEYLSYEPYGIMYRKNDAQLTAAISHSFAEMAEADDFEHIYDQWFMRRLPSGERINLPMSPQLENIFASLGTHPE